MLVETKICTKEAYHWQLQPRITTFRLKKQATKKNFQANIKHSKKRESSRKIAKNEFLTYDSWVADLDKLGLPDLVHQLTMHAFPEFLENNKLVLHLRSTQSHLNSCFAKRILSRAISDLYGYPFELIILEDDNPDLLTPLEKSVYEDKLLQARLSIATDINTQALERFFNAKLDLDSICLL
nr:DNA polymerase III subunit gamma/tau C-terminal domain-containing protein [Candidatus Profftia tarda]